MIRIARIPRARIFAATVLGTALMAIAGVGALLIVQPADATAQPRVPDFIQVSGQFSLEGLPGDSEAFYPDAPMLQTGAEQRYVPATSKMVIREAGISPEENGYSFYANAEVGIWMGLDGDGNPMRIGRRQGRSSDGPEVQEEPVSFQRMGVSDPKQVSISAELYIVGTSNPVQTMFVDVNAGEPFQIKFEAIPYEQRILPGNYQIRLELSQRQQRAVAETMWIEEFARDYIDTDGDDETPPDEIAFVRRLNPSNAPVTRSSIDIGVAGYNLQRGDYEFSILGVANERRLMLQWIETISSLQEEVSELRQVRERDMNQEIRLQEAMYQLAEYNLVRQNAGNVAQLEQQAQRFEVMAINIQGAITRFRDRTYAQLQAISDEVYRQSRHLYWMYNLCRPGFNLPPDTEGTDPFDLTVHDQTHNVLSMRNHYHENGFPILAALGGDSDVLTEAFDPNTDEGDDPIKGEWEAGVWLRWLNETWLPALEELRSGEEGLAMIYGNPDAPDPFDRRGLDQEGNPLFWEAYKKQEYQNIIRFLDNAELAAQACANNLAALHASNENDIRYPFVDDTPRAAPRPIPEAASRMLNLVLREAVRLVSEFGLPGQRPGSTGVTRAPVEELDETYYRHRESGLTLRESVWEELPEAEREMYDPVDPDETEGGQ